jgi:RNA polymerase sigma-70 factor, ECF subfamily
MVRSHPWVVGQGCAGPTVSLGEAPTPLSTRLRPTNWLLTLTHRGIAANGPLPVNPPGGAGDHRRPHPPRSRGPAPRCPTGWGWVRAAVMIGPSFPELLAAAQRGDQQAFAVLWRDLHPAVLRYLRVAAPSAAEDLAADSWLSVIDSLGRFGGHERAFRAWVFTIARHRAIDWHRQSTRRRTEPLGPELAGERPAPDDPAAEVMEADATRAALALLATLPPSQAEVVALRVLDGLEVAEVAQITGRRPNAVRVLAHRGLRRLAGRLASTEGAERRVTR